jgi:hypothetical protein
MHTYGNSILILLIPYNMAVKVIFTVTIFQDDQFLNRHVNHA